MKHRLHSASTAAILVAALAGAAGAWAADDTAPLEREIERLSALSGGTMGIAVRHLSSGRTVYLNPDERLPLASHYTAPTPGQPPHPRDPRESPP